MFNILKVIGGITIAIVILAIANAPEKPQKQLTDTEIKAGITRSYCRELVANNLKVPDSAEMPITRSYPTPVDDGGVVWSYTNTMRAENAFGVMLHETFECRVSFAMGKEKAVFLKIGNNILIGD